MAAVERGEGLVLAIEQGAARGKADAIDQVAQHLCKEALKVDESAWHSDELERLVPLDTRDATGFPCWPTSGEIVPDKKEVWCWALRMGYARDRVIAYARVKAAMLDVGNLSCAPELQKELFGVWGRVNAGLREAELTYEARDPNGLASPAVELEAMRAQWLRAGADVIDAEQQQPTLLRTPLVLGLTAREVVARAADPFLEDEATFRVGAEVRGTMPARDALMGTETFVSFVFPATDHQEMFAVGASSAGVRATDAHKMPAIVTLHNATGAVQQVASCMSAPKPYNVFVTDDAATLLANLHSLILAARRTSDGRPRPLEEQRNYLLLQHGVL